MSNQANDELYDHLLDLALTQYEDPEIAKYWAERKLQDLI